MTRIRRRSFYRTPVTRWSFILTGVLAAWGLSPAGLTQLREAPAVRWLHQLIPFPLMVAGFVVYVALLLWNSRAAFQLACGIGMGIFATYASAACVTIAEGFPGSSVALAALVDVVTMHYAALRLAEFDRHGPT